MNLAARLDAVLDGRRLTEAEAADLLRLPPEAREPVRAAADRLNRRLNGDRVSYVVNRNVNFTNVCTAACRFCAFRAAPGADEAFILTPDEVAAIVKATPEIDEVCMVGGLHPDLTFDDLAALVAAVYDARQDVHQHAFSPMEIATYADKAGLTAREAFERLLEVGYGSLCGTAAEVLVDEVRAEICPAKLSSARWVEIVRTAHEMGIRSTSTMLFGHVETPEHVARHWGILRDLQAETGGFTEYIPLPFMPYRTPLAREDRVTRMVPTADVMLHYAVARLFFGELIPNVQTSWVKLGLEAARESFAWGVNDLGGTLLAESITRLAGGTHGEALTEAQLVEAICAAGRTPVRRDTLYHRLDASVPTR